MPHTVAADELIVIDSADVCSGRAELGQRSRLSSPRFARADEDRATSAQPRASVVWVEDDGRSTYAQRLAGRDGSCARHESVVNRAAERDRAACNSYPLTARYQVLHLAGPWSAASLMNSGKSRRRRAAKDRTKEIGSRSTDGLRRREMDSIPVLSALLLCAVFRGSFPMPNSFTRSFAALPRNTAHSHASVQGNHCRCGVSVARCGERRAQKKTEARGPPFLCRFRSAD